MTDPVDTDALRHKGEVLVNDGRMFGPRITEAAEDAYRLSDSIERAPHAPECEQWDLQPQTGRPVTDRCTCWKADAL